MKKMLHRLLIPAFVLTAVIITESASGQTYWSGGGVADKNWSTAANWLLGTPPGAFDTALFGADATVANATTVNNTVDATTTIGALSYTNSTSTTWHVTEIPSGNMLTVSGSVTVGGATGTGAPTFVTQVAMVGGGTFIANGSPFNVGNGGSAGGLNSGTILNLSGLTNFYYSATDGTMGIGAINRSIATLNLAAGSNSVTVGTINLNTGSTSSSGSGVALRFGGGTNVINANTINLAAGRTSGTAQFAGSTGGLTLRGTGGTDSDRANITLGHRNTGSSSGGTTTGTLSCNGHPVDMKIATLILGRNSRSGSEAGLIGTGVFAYDQGTVDATTINMGVMSGNSPTAAANGTLTVGANGTLSVGGVSLVNVTSTGVGTTATGNLNIFGGLVNCSGDIVKSTSLGTGNIALGAGGRLNMGSSSRLGTAGMPIDSLVMTNSLLQLPVFSGEASANVSSLVTGGTTNIVNITGTIPPVTGYPAQLTVLKYSGGIGGVGNNIGLGTLPASIGDPYVGYISNNTVNASIDLVLTSGLEPAKLITWNGTPTGNWEAGSGTVANWLFGSTPISFNQTDFVTFDDSASGATAVNLTTTLLPTAVTVNNSAKSYTFSGPGLLSGGTGLTKEGAGTLTIANDVANDFTGPIAINGGTLRYNQFSGVAIANVISGAGAFNHAGSGTLTLSGVNTLTGPITVTQGTLVAGNASALGSAVGGTTVQSGAALDVNGLNLGAEPVTASGSGVGGTGAIINSGARIFPALRHVTLVGNTTFGGPFGSGTTEPGRWDIRYSSSGSTDPALSTLSTGGNAYNLTKVGANYVGICNVTVDPALANVDIQEGTLSLQYNTTSLGNPANTVTVAANAYLNFFNLTNLLDKKIVLADLANISTASGAGANTIAGPVTLNGTGVFTIDGTSSLTLNGVLNGAGAILQYGTGTLTVNGNGSGLANGANINSGTFGLNGTLGGGLTNQAGATVVGSGTNTGVLEAWGNVVPGASNVVGTLTVGGLVMQGNLMVYDLTYANTPGAGVNDLVVVKGDLVVNGGTIAVQTVGLLQQGVPYRLFTYTGTLFYNSPLSVPDQGGYSFAVDTTTPGQVNLLVTARPPVWNGGSATTSSWSDPANWSGTAISSGSILYFDGNNRLINNNDTAAGTQYGDINFANNAGAFTLNGNPITLGGNIINNSANPQMVNLGLSFGANYAFNGATDTLIIGGGVTNTANLTTLTLAGTGILSNRLVSADANTITNILALTSTNASWTLVDNPSSTAITNPVQLDVQAGTFNIGQGSSAPVLSSTAANNNSRLGVIANSPATLNMVNGTLTIAARFNTGAGGNTIATLNQTGGTMIFEDIFQGADSSATAVSTVNVSGGLFTVGESETSPNTLFLCSRGVGTLTISSSGLVRCGTLDVSRNASGAGSVGVVNLNGGALHTTRVGTGTGSFGAGGSPTATFNFNGGTLKARASSTTFFQGRAEIPIMSVVKAGGAIIDSDTNAVSILEPLQHDSALGGTADGGLTKLGVGTVTLTAANTYTGPTVVNAGALLVNGSLVAASPVTVVSGGILGGAGNIGGTATVNVGGTIAPGTATGIGTLTVANAVLHGSTFIKLNKSATPAPNDILAASTLSLGGTLNATNAGPMLNSGDSFTLFSGAWSGSIAPGTLPPLWPGLTWDTTQLSSLGKISVVGTLIPPQIAGDISGTNFVLTGSGGVVGASYRVLASANVAAPLASWVPVATNVFDASGNLNLSIGVNPSVPMLFYRLQVP